MAVFSPRIKQESHEYPHGGVVCPVFSSLRRDQTQYDAYSLWSSPRLPGGRGSPAIICAAALASILAVFFLVSYCSMLQKKQRLRMSAGRNLAEDNGTTGTHTTEHDARPICEATEYQPASTQQAPEMSLKLPIADANDESAGTSSSKRKMEHDSEKHDGFLLQSKRAKGQVKLPGESAVNPVLDSTLSQLIDETLAAGDSALSLEGWLFDANDDFEEFPNVASDEPHQAGGHLDFIMDSSGKEAGTVSSKRQFQSGVESLMYRPSAVSRGFFEGVSTHPQLSQKAPITADGLASTQFSSAPVFPEASHATPLEFQPPSTLSAMYGGSSSEHLQFFGQTSTEQGYGQPPSEQGTDYEGSSSQHLHFVGPVVAGGGYEQRPLEQAAAYGGTPSQYFSSSGDVTGRYEQRPLEQAAAYGGTPSQYFSSSGEVTGPYEQRPLEQAAAYGGTPYQHFSLSGDVTGQQGYEQQATLPGETSSQVFPPNGQVTAQEGYEQQQLAQPGVSNMSSQYHLPFVGQTQQSSSLAEQHLPFARDIETHPFVRLPRVAPGAVVRGMKWENIKPPPGSSRNAYHILRCIRRILKLPILGSTELLDLVISVERLVSHALYCMDADTTHLKPKLVARKLAFGFMLLDSLYSASEVLGRKARRNEWWPAVLNAIPFFVGPFRNVPKDTAESSNINLALLLDQSIDFYRRGMRAPPEVLIRVKRLIAMTTVSHRLQQVTWRSWAYDDREWQSFP